jgi:hypothetical protein
VFGVCGLGSAGGAPSRAFCCEIALLGPAPWPGAQDYRQRLYGAILQRRILAGTDLVFEQLRGPLMILLLQEQVFSVELWPVERGEARVGLSMLGVQVMCHRNTLMFADFGELSVGFGVVLDHMAREGFDRIAFADLLGKVR